DSTECQAGNPGSGVPGKSPPVKYRNRPYCNRKPTLHIFSLGTSSVARDAIGGNNWRVTSPEPAHLFPLPMMFRVSNAGYFEVSRINRIWDTAPGLNRSTFIPRLFTKFR